MIFLKTKMIKMKKNKNKIFKIQKILNKTKTKMISNQLKKKLNLKKSLTHKLTIMLNKKIKKMKPNTGQRFLLTFLQV